MEVADYVRVKLRGTTERISLFEIKSLTSEAASRLAPPEHESKIFAGKRWLRVMQEDELVETEWRVLEIDDTDVVVCRLADGTYHAFNNACPHLHIPLFDRRRHLKEGDIGINTNTGLARPLCSEFTEDRGLVCR